MPATNLLFKAGSQNPQNQPWLTAQFLGTLQNEVTAPRSSVTHPRGMRRVDTAGSRTRTCPGPTGHHSQLPWQAGPSEPRQPPAQRGSSVSKTRFNLSLPLLSQRFEDKNISITNGIPQVAKQAGQPPRRAPQQKEPQKLG